MKKLLKGKWVVPVATLVLTLSIGSAAFAATGSDSTDTSTADTSTAVTSTAPTATDATATTDATSAASSTDDSAAAANSATSGNPWGNQRSDEALLTGSTAEQVKAVAIAKVGSDATVVRVETDAEGNAKYEVHMVKADGTAVTVYIDESFKFVSVEDQPSGGQRGGQGGHRGGPAAADSTTDKDSGATNSTTADSTSTSSN